VQKHTLELLNPDFGVCMSTYEKENKDALLRRLGMHIIVETAFLLGQSNFFFCSLPEKCLLKSVH
jgi:hypothetical protein